AYRLRACPACNLETPRSVANRREAGTHHMLVGGSIPPSCWRECTPYARLTPRGVSARGRCELREPTARADPQGVAEPHVADARETVRVDPQLAVQLREWRCCQWQLR